MFNPLDFVEVTHQFCEDDLGEARYRTAISRAYYAVFLQAREDLEKRGEHVKVLAREDRRSEHGRVRERFKWRPRESRPFQHDRVWERLGALYSLRIQADYYLDESVAKEDVDQALRYVEYIMWVFDDMFK